MDTQPVKFEEEDVLVDKASQISRRTALSGIVMKLGLAKSESQANYVLIGIMLVCLIATLFVISKYLV